MAVVVAGMAVGEGNKVMVAVDDTMDGAVVAAVEDSADVHLGVPGVVGNTVVGASEVHRRLPVACQDKLSSEPEDADLGEEAAAGTAAVAGIAVVEHQRNFVMATTGAVAQLHMGLAAAVAARQRMAEELASEA